MNTSCTGEGTSSLRIIVSISASPALNRATAEYRLRMSLERRKEIKADGQLYEACKHDHKPRGQFFQSQSISTILAQTYLAVIRTFLSPYAGGTNHGPCGIFWCYSQQQSTNNIEKAWNQPVDEVKWRLLDVCPTFVNLRSSDCGSYIRAG